MSEKRIRQESRHSTATRHNVAKRSKIFQRSVAKKKRISPQAPTIAYVLDGGAYTIKAGVSTEENPFVMPNCIMKAKSERKRPFIGNEIEECRDLSGLFYMLPCEKGYISRWDVQKPIWDYLFQHKQLLPGKPLIMTQPLMNFRSIQECLDEIFYEEYDVKSMFRTNPTDLIQYEYTKKVLCKDTDCLVIDTGYSFTHVVPYVNGFKYFPGVKRIDVGGKLLTNYLKDIISYRQLHVMEETHVMNQVKEDACFVSQNLQSDMHISASANDNSILKNYVLPDFNNIRRGYLQSPDNDSSETLEGYQILKLNNERFTVPEILLRPSNIGLEQQGIAETVVTSILKCPTTKQTNIARNIILAGGSAKFPGLRERIEQDVQQLAPHGWTVNVFLPNNPIEFAWSGGTTLAGSNSLHQLLVSKQDYEEHGSNYTYRKFNSMKVKKKECLKNDDVDVSLIDNPYSHWLGKGRIVNELHNHISSGINAQDQNQRHEDEEETQEAGTTQFETQYSSKRKQKINLCFFPI